MLLDYTQCTMSTYTADCSGVASALYELGGMTVIHDASGCNSTYSTHDEPRWTTMPSAVYISALTEMDAVLGNEAHLVDDVVTACSELSPAFVAIAGTPIPMMTGSDLKGLARLIERESGIASFAVATNSMRPYSVGVAQSWIEIARRFVEPRPKIQGAPSLNILGATPLDFSTGPMLDSLKKAAQKAGYEVNACWAMGSTLQQLASSAQADVNAVVSASGLPLAQYLQARFGTPYVVGLPVGALATRWRAALDEAAQSRLSVSLDALIDAPAAGARRAVLGEPVAAACTAAAANLMAPGTTRAVSALPALGAEAAILTDNLSEDRLRETLRGTQVLAADPLFDIIAGEAGVERTVRWVHEACSGRIWRDEIVDILNDAAFGAFADSLLS